MRVVRILRREIPHRGLGLHLHVVLVVVDFEQRFRRLEHAPHDDGRDLDRVALKIVDLELGALEVAHAERDLALAVERVRPVKAVRLHRAPVLAEEDERPGFVRVDDEEPGEHEQHDEDDREPDGEDGVLRPGAFNQEQDARNQGPDEQGQHQPAGHSLADTLANHGRLQGTSVTS